jgi:hypothetical protein
MVTHKQECEFLPNFRRRDGRARNNVGDLAGRHAEALCRFGLAACARGLAAAWVSVTAPFADGVSLLLQSRRRTRFALG